MSNSPPPPFPILLLDGGLGTTLETNHSQNFTSSTPLWSSQLLLSDPSKEILLSAQRSFVDAGCDVLLSATYQASLEGFARTRRRDVNTANNGVEITEVEAGKDEEFYGEEEAMSISRSAIPLARTAISSSRTKLALSLGPYGAILSPSQEYTANYPPNHQTLDPLLSWHKNRLNIYQSDPSTWYEIDYIAFETLPKLEEIEAVRKAVYDSVGGWDRKFWVSCVFPGEENRLPDGSGVKEVVKAMLGGGEGKALPWGIGINCTKISRLPSIIAQFEEAVEKLMAAGEVDGWPFLVVYPDGAEGLVYNTATQVWEEKKLERDLEPKIPWDEAMIEIIKGVRDRRKWRGLLVGGCCKVLPSDIGKLRVRIDEL